jgi:signal transduction histidine kinase
VPELDAHIWSRLPDDDLHEAACRGVANYLGLPAGSLVLAAPGTQSVIQVLPQLGEGDVAIVSPDDIPSLTMIPGKYVRLIVTDTGHGMDEDFIKNQLFRPFKSTKGKGMGIGVYETKEIIHALGGSIDVESSPGKGSCFTIKLPKA